MAGRTTTRRVPDAAVDLRERIFVTLEDPASSSLASLAAGVVLSFIIVSIIAYLAGTLTVFAGPDGEPGSCPLLDGVSLGGFSARDPLEACDPAEPDPAEPCEPCAQPTAAWWEGVETLCVFVFSLEYGARLVCCPPLRRASWVLEPLNVVDLVAILPWYLEAVLGSQSNTQVVRALRLLRIFRISKASQKFALLHIFLRTMQRSWSPLGLTALLVAIACTLFSSLVWFAERGEWDAEAKQWLREDGSVSPFESIPASMWWCIVTFTTVGYGDMAPVTAWGQLWGVLAMLAGLLVIALPSSVVGTNFEAVFAQRSLGAKLERRGLGSIEDLDDAELKAEARLATAWDAGAPDGGLTMGELTLARVVFPRWEARSREMVRFTEQIGGLLHQLEATSALVEGVCNAHAVDAHGALRQPSFGSLLLPKSPKNVRASGLYSACDDLFREGDDDDGGGGGGGDAPRSSTSRKSQKSQLLGDEDADG